MEIDGYQWLIILHHKYGLSIQSSLNIGTNLMSLNHLQIGLISKQ